MAEKEQNNNFDELREKAEHKVNQEKKPLQSEYEQEVIKIIHELHVHQVELEMQNVELRRTREELEISRNKFSDLFDFAPIGYFVLDTKGNITEVNLTGANMLGIERSQINKKPFAIFVYNGDKDTFFINRQKVLKTSNDNKFDLKMVRKDKSQFYAEIYLKPIIDNDQKISHCLLAVIDITQRMNNREILHESEKRYRSLFNTMTEGFALHEIICDEKGNPCDYRFLDVNPAFEKQTGLKAQDIIGKTIREVIPGIEQFWIDTYGKIALTGKSKNFENFSKPLNKHYDVFAYCPEPMQFAAIFLDITKRKKAEEALAASENKYRELIETANSIIIRWDRNGIIRFINTFGAKFFGYSVDELRGQNVIALIPKVENTTGRDLVALAKDIVIHPEQFTFVPNENIKKDGESVWVAWTNKAIFDEHGQVQEILAIGNDITEIKKAEIALQVSNEELNKFNKYAVGRELRMIELKKEVNEICLKAGLPKRYNIDFTDNDKQETYSKK